MLPYPDHAWKLDRGGFRGDALQLPRFRRLATLDPFAPVPELPDCEFDEQAGGRGAEDSRARPYAARPRQG